MKTTTFHLSGALTLDHIFPETLEEAEHAKEKFLIRAGNNVLAKMSKSELKALMLAAEIALDAFPGR